MLSKTEFEELFRAQIPFEPTSGQSEAIGKLSSFVCEKSENQLFILKGYAGTGKTTLVSALVNALDAVHSRTILLAPTGRAAKVFSVYSGKKAYTIHKHLYRVQVKDGIAQFKRKENKACNTLFIVDEVSMIGNSNQGDSLIGSHSLLDDLFDFVFEGENCKILFIGDDAQLPPVGSEESPALDVEFLNSLYHLNIQQFQLTEVVRQAYDSGILFNANILRSKIGTEDFFPPLFSQKPYPDFQRINGGELEEELNTLFSRNEEDDIVIITRSNKRAYIFNREIRNRILYRENEIATGDFLMAVKNNYYWLDEDSEAGFIANGDIMEILAINKQIELYGFHFADVTVRLCDYPNYPHIDIRIILESLSCEGASLSGEQNHQLYLAVAEDYADIASKRQRYLKIKNDPYLNAVQVKYSYALTCHKTQGGQWKNVLIDSPYLKDGVADKEYLRWLYTAVTRATDKVYLINFDDQMFA